MVESQPNSPESRHHWYQYSMRSLMVFVTIVAVLCSIGACTHWVVPIGLFVLAISVPIVTVVTTRETATFAHIFVIGAQFLGFGVNLFPVIIMFMIGTYTRSHFDNLRPLFDFLCNGIFLINCLALLIPQRATVIYLLPLVIVGNCITLGLGILAIVYPTFYMDGGVGSFIMLYGITFISTNAIAVKIAYLTRID
jgi:hypothetical protein